MSETLTNETTERRALPPHAAAVLAELQSEHQLQAQGVLRAARLELQIGPEWQLDPKTNEFVRAK